MGLKIGVSKLVHEWLGEGEIVDRSPKRGYDVTIIAASEDDIWVDKAHRRLRPHFVNTPAEARKIYDLYQAYGKSE